MRYNWSIIGHEKQLSQIELDLESGNLSHAYLLAGPNSVGKYTVANKFAGILQCKNNFCHKCNTCIQVTKGSHIDTIEIKDDGESIKIDDVRKLTERLNMTSQSSYCVTIIQSIERMTIAAANSFLKTLEEPPQNTIFILTTNNIRELLPTIVSRVRTVAFSTVSFEYLTEKLAVLYPDSDKEMIRQVALFSLGKTGKAVHLMENPESFSNYFKVYRDVQGFLDHRNLADRFAYVDELFNDSKQIDVFFNILTNVLRSKLLDESLYSKQKKHINSLLKISETGILLKQNVNLRLALENLMLSL